MVDPRRRANAEAATDLDMVAGAVSETSAPRRRREGPNAGRRHNGGKAQRHTVVADQTPSSRRARGARNKPVVAFVCGRSDAFFTKGTKFTIRDVGSVCLPALPSLNAFRHVAGNSAPVQVEPSGHLVGAQVRVAGAPPHLPAQLFGEPRFALTLVL